MNSVADLHINGEKIRAEHPDLIGSITVGSETYAVALWFHLTRDGAREYYSGVLQLAGNRRAPRYQLKLYEMRRTNDSEPHFHTPAQAQVGSHYLFGYLWIRPAPADGPDELAIRLELSDLARTQRLTEQAEKFRNHLRARVSGDPAPVCHNEFGEPNDINL